MPDSNDPPRARDGRRVAQGARPGADGPRLPPQQQHPPGRLRPLKQRLGLCLDRPVRVKSKMMQDVLVDDEVLNALDIDVRGVFYGAPGRRRTGRPAGRHLDRRVGRAPGEAGNRLVL